MPTHLSTPGSGHRSGRARPPARPVALPTTRSGTDPAARRRPRAQALEAVTAAADRAEGGAAETDACEVFAADAGRMARACDRLVPAATASALAETFRVLGDATRVRILDAVSYGELCVCDIATLVGMSESAVSHQLRLLRTMRLVKARRSGRMVFYTLDDHHIIDLFAQGLRHVQEA